MFWIAFQLGALVGFVFLGIAAFKLTEDEMNAEAGKSLYNAAIISWTNKLSIFFSARFLPT